MATYHLDFHTNTPAPGWISCVKIVISKTATKSGKGVFRLDLCDDPCYRALHQYVMANPPRTRKADSSQD